MRTGQKMAWKGMRDIQHNECFSVYRRYGCCKLEHNTVPEHCCNINVLIARKLAHQAWGVQQCVLRNITPAVTHAVHTRRTHVSGVYFVRRGNKNKSAFWKVSFTHLHDVIVADASLLIRSQGGMDCACS